MFESVVDYLSEHLGLVGLIAVLALFFAWRATLHWPRRSALGQERALARQQGEDLLLAFHPDNATTIEVSPGDTLPLVLRNTGESRLKNVRVGVRSAGKALVASDKWKATTHPVKYTADTWELKKPITIHGGGRQVEIRGLKLSPQSPTTETLHWHVWIGKWLASYGHSLTLRIR